LEAGIVGLICLKQTNEHGAYPTTHSLTTRTDHRKSCELHWLSHRFGSIQDHWDRSSHFGNPMKSSCCCPLFPSSKRVA